MQENDQQSTNIQDYVTQAKVPGERVIQPSASFIEEMKSQQQSTLPPQPQAPQPVDAPPVQSATLDS